MHKIESREISNRKYLSKTILACRSRQAKNTLVGFKGQTPRGHINGITKSRKD